MREGKNKICTICGKTCRPGGIGAHMRLKHGIKVKTIVKHISGHISDASDLSGDVSDIRVQRPGDYVKKRSEVVETRIEPAIESILADKYNLLGREECLRRIWCVINAVKSGDTGSLKFSDFQGQLPTVQGALSWWLMFNYELSGDLVFGEMNAFEHYCWGKGLSIRGRHIIFAQTRGSVIDHEFYKEKYDLFKEYLPKIIDQAPEASDLVEGDQGINYYE